MELNKLSFATHGNLRGASHKKVELFSGQNIFEIINLEIIYL